MNYHWCLFSEANKSIFWYRRTVSINHIWSSTRNAYRISNLINCFSRFQPKTIMRCLARWPVSGYLICTSLLIQSIHICRSSSWFIQKVLVSSSLAKQCCVLYVWLILQLYFCIHESNMEKRWNMTENSELFLWYHLLLSTLCLLRSLCTTHDVAEKNCAWLRGNSALANS